MSLAYQQNFTNKFLEFSGRWHFSLQKIKKEFPVNTSSTNCHLLVDACDQNHGILELFCLVIVNSTRNPTPHTYLSSVIRISFLPNQSFFRHKNNMVLNLNTMLEFFTWIGPIVQTLIKIMREKDAWKCPVDKRVEKNLTVQPNCWTNVR